MAVCGTYYDLHVRSNRVYIYYSSIIAVILHFSQTIKGFAEFTQLPEQQLYLNKRLKFIHYHFPQNCQLLLQLII